MREAGHLHSTQDILCTKTAGHYKVGRVAAEWGSGGHRADCVENAKGSSRKRWHIGVLDAGTTAKSKSSGTASGAQRGKCILRTLARQSSTIESCGIKRRISDQPA